MASRHFWRRISPFRDVCYKKSWVICCLVQSLSHVWLFANPWTAVCQGSLSFTTTQSLLRLMSFESVMPTNHLILCCPLLLLPSIFPSIRVFSNESILWIRWPKDWSLSYRVSPSNEYSGMTSFRMDWLDILTISRVVSSTTVGKHQLLGTQPSLRSNSHICTWLLEKQQLWQDRPCLLLVFISKKSLH